jgi:hypothetical protein
MQKVLSFLLFAVVLLVLTFVANLIVEKSTNLTGLSYKLAVYVVTLALVGLAIGGVVLVVG